MGFFDKLFTRSNVGNSSNVDKISLIKDLVKLRIKHNPIESGDIDEELIVAMPDEIVMGFPEATLVWIIENWSIFYKQGLKDDKIFPMIENYRSKTLSRGLMPTNPNLHNYIKYRVVLEHFDDAGGTFHDQFIEEAINMTKKRFGVR